MVDKMIQIDVDKLKEQFQKITEYYGDTRVAEREISSAISDMNNMHLVDAYKHLTKVMDGISSGNEEVRKLRRMLTDAGCVLD